MEVKEELSLVLNYTELPAFENAEEKQRLLVESNPFVEITDNKTYEQAKKSRTSLREGRYELQNGEKTIASRLKDFRDLIKNKTAELIGITLEAENKQQAEIERYEAEKQREKEEALRAERARKEALRQQVFDFNTSKAKAIETATITTISAIISDIENSDLQLEEFTADFISVKNRLIEEAKRKESQLQESERLRIEREKAEQERKKLEDERKKLEAEKKKQEDELKLQREKEEAEMKRKREEEESRLKAEREKLNAEKAAFQKSEDERKAKEEAELKEKLEAERKENEAKEKAEFEKREQARQEVLKPDKQKLTELIEKFDTSQFIIELEMNESRVLLNEFVHALNQLRGKTLELIKEL